MNELEKIAEQEKSSRKRIRKIRSFFLQKKQSQKLCYSNKYVRPYSDVFMSFINIQKYSARHCKRFHDMLQ